MSEVWQDLGYDTSRKVHVSSKLKRMLETTFVESKKKKNLEILRGLFGEHIEDKNQITVKVLGRTIDIWPASGTYYSHAKNQYGHDIDQLCRKINSLLTQQDKPEFQVICS